MSKELYMVILVLVMAAVTYAIRAVPFVLFRKKIKSQYLLNVLFYVPYAVLAAMTFPAIFYCTGNIYTALIGTAVALAASFMKAPMLVAATLSSLSVFLFGFVF